MWSLKTAICGTRFASPVAPFQGAGGWRRNHTQGCACGLTLGYRYVAPSGQPEACEETKPTSVPGSNNPKPQVPIPMPQSPHIPEGDGQAQPCNGGLLTSLKRMDKHNPAMGSPTSPTGMDMRNPAMGVSDIPNGDGHAQPCNGGLPTSPTGMDNFSPG